MRFQTGRFASIISILMPTVLVVLAGCRTPGDDVTFIDRVADRTPSTDDGGQMPPRATVTAVVDGDTIVVELAGRPYRVRLLGVDSPESVHPELPEQCYGQEATRGLSRLLPPGTDIIIERDVDLHDRYQRLLLYVYRRNDGLFVNRWLVEQGLAEAVFYPPNTHFRPELQAARQQARAAGRGLWGHCEGPDQPLR